MKTKDKLILVGALLIGFGIFMFFKSTRVWSFGFYRLGGQVSTGGILIALILLDVILLAATRHKAAKIALPVLGVMLVLSVILGTHLSFTGSVLDLFLMLVPAAVGAGLLLRAFLKK
ncbi:MAG: hypothetical protein II062_05560 [Oscillospiraceae bacterium]|nr:hypothetical protein [Oscillospiraceae bacterium]MBR7009707.1 hypothetical protein [Oscillospiraceae bacterium]